MANDFIWQRGRQYYWRHPIPRPLRKHFPSSTGKPQARLVRPLGDGYTAAKVKAANLTAACLNVFARLRAGEPMTADQIETALRGQHPLVGAFSAQYPTAWAALKDAPPVSLPAWLPESVPTPAPAQGETISQAAEAWFAELTAKGGKQRRDTTLDEHRRRVQRFIKDRGDLPLADVTRQVASDFLAKLNVHNRTRNNYAMTLKCVFKSAGRRGRFSNREEDNPFGDQRTKTAAGSNRVPFTDAELQTLFDALPREIEPAKHTPETALPWVALIALYSGARLEEIAQLTTADIRNEGANGASVWVIDIHNGGTNKLKNETSARLVPVHSALVRAGFLDYVKALPAGSLFPGLVRRESKGGKIGARLGELFRKKLVALGLKRDGLCFHSFRHTVAGRLDAAGVPINDAARVLGHAVPGMSYGTYSQGGPGLIRVKDVVEKITYAGLRV
jgi:integrase